MIVDLRLRPEHDGRVFRHSYSDRTRSPHRHAEVEVNLAVRGTATYLLDDRRYALTSGTLTWLFPGRDHLLVDESTDHEAWWAVFRADLIARTARSTESQPLRHPDPVGHFCRRLDAKDVARLVALFREVFTAQGDDEVLFNTGLAYLLMYSWRAFLSSDDDVDGVGLHPAVEKVVRLLSAGANDGGLAALARAAGFSPSHLSRLFSKQIGMSITAFRNQQRLRRFALLYDRGRRTTALDAALGAGFGSYAQFHRVFRRQTGRTPSALRTMALDDDPTAAR